MPTNPSRDYNYDKSYAGVEQTVDAEEVPVTKKDRVCLHNCNLQARSSLLSVRLSLALLVCMPHRISHECLSTKQMHALSIDPMRDALPMNPCSSSTCSMQLKFP